MSSHICDAPSTIPLRQMSGDHCIDQSPAQRHGESFDNYSTVDIDCQSIALDKRHPLLFGYSDQTGILIALRPRLRTRCNGSPPYSRFLRIATRITMNFASCRITFRPSRHDRLHEPKLTDARTSAGIAKGVRRAPCVDSSGTEVGAPDSFPQYAGSGTALSG
jgi:hypothetical protein